MSYDELTADDMLEKYVQCRIDKEDALQRMRNAEAAALELKRLLKSAELEASVKGKDLIACIPQETFREECFRVLDGVLHRVDSQYAELNQAH